MFSFGIALCYFTIPVLIGVVRRSIHPALRVPEFDRALTLFEAFVLACGIGHAISGLNYWLAWYWVEVGWHLLTFAISAYTGIFLWSYRGGASTLRSSQQLEMAQRVTDAAFAGSAIGTAFVNLDGTFRRVSTRFAEIIGTTPDQLVGKTYASITHPDDIGPDDELYARTKLPPEDEDHLPYYQLKKRYRCPRVGWRWVLLSVKTVRDSAGEPVFAFVQIVDIHEAELAHAALLTSNRELEQFAYVTSHDLQEPLRMISSFVELLADKYGDSFDERGRKWMQFVVEGSTRMKTMIDGLLQLSRVNTRGQPFGLVDLNKVMSDVLASRVDGAKYVQVGLLPTIMGDVSQLHRLLQNLVGNALKFRRDGVDPEIHVQAQDRGSSWDLTVTDNGLGIPEEHRDQIFVIFRRLHDRSKYPGTGMGLAICKQIAERHGGLIRCEAAEPHGTRFVVTLPKEPIA